MPGTAKVPGFESDQNLFFFQTGNILFLVFRCAHFFKCCFDCLFYFYNLIF